jgi:hypothetical protein
METSMAPPAWVADCHGAALQDLLRSARAGDLPESIVYLEAGRPTLDSWIRPCASVRLWSTVQRNAGLFDRVASQSLGEATRLDHVLAEIVATNPAEADGPGSAPPRRRHFALGFMPDGPFQGKLKFLRVLPGRVISPDWLFMDKIKAQLARPEQRHLQLLAAGVLTQKTFCRLRDLVESQGSRIRRHGDKDGRHVYEVVHPAMGAYQGLTCPDSLRKNCASFVAELFKDMIVCANLLNLAIPGACRPLQHFSCSEEGLSRRGELDCGRPEEPCEAPPPPSGKRAAEGAGGAGAPPGKRARSS